MGNSDEITDHETSICEGEPEAAGHVPDSQSLYHRESFCGVFAILSVFNGQHLSAAIAILVGMIFDMLDGKLARLTNSTGQFGIEYDSLSDVVSFAWRPVC